MQDKDKAKRRHSFNTNAETEEATEKELPGKKTPDGKKRNKAKEAPDAAMPGQEGEETSVAILVQGPLFY